MRSVDLRAGSAMNDKPIPVPGGFKGLMKHRYRNSSLWMTCHSLTVFASVKIRVPGK